MILDTRGADRPGFKGLATANSALDAGPLESQAPKGRFYVVQVPAIYDGERDSTPVKHFGSEPVEYELLARLARASFRNCTRELGPRDSADTPRRRALVRVCC